MITIESLNAFDCTGSGTYWQIKDVRVATLEFECSVFMETKGGPPTIEHLNHVVKWVNMDVSTRDWIGNEMRKVFNEHIRKHYDLPLVVSANGIWVYIAGINGITVEENGDVDFEFIPSFDASHDFAVRIHDGKFYEVMLDG
jgi:hypothetical protein